GRPRRSASRTSPSPERAGTANDGAASPSARSPKPSSPETRAELRDGESPARTATTVTAPISAITTIAMPVSIHAARVERFTLIDLGLQHVRSLRDCENRRHAAGCVVGDRAVDGVLPGREVDLARARSAAGLQFEPVELRFAERERVTGRT